MLMDEQRRRRTHGSCQAHGPATRTAGRARAAKGWPLPHGAAPRCLAPLPRRVRRHRHPSSCRDLPCPGGHDRGRHGEPRLHRFPARARRGHRRGGRRRRGRRPLPHKRRAGPRWRRTGAGTRLHRHPQPPRRRTARRTHGAGGGEPGHHDDRRRSGRGIAVPDRRASSRRWRRPRRRSTWRRTRGTGRCGARSWATTSGARPRRIPRSRRCRRCSRPSLRDGVLGLSTGLEYDPGIYSTTDEVVALAQTAAASDARYISHMRSEDRALHEAIEETIEIG